ncbi:hypothetical protein HDU82_002196, partial [Entophlyctis luteolus]
VVAANERKAAQEEAKNAALAAKTEAEEAASWSKGAKANKREDDERKKAEAAAKKAERDALLQAEEAEFSKKKPTAAPKASITWFSLTFACGKAAGAPSLASMAQKMAHGLSSADNGALSNSDGAPETYAASGIDAALELLDLTTKKPANAAQAIEKHPERRMKSAWAAFEERELPILKAENPGMRLSQLKQALQKKWKKSPENPMNSELVAAYNTTADEARAAVDARKDESLERMRV